MGRNIRGCRVDFVGKSGESCWGIPGMVYRWGFVFFFFSYRLWLNLSLGQIVDIESDESWIVCASMKMTVLCVFIIVVTINWELKIMLSLLWCNGSNDIHIKIKEWGKFSYQLRDKIRIGDANCFINISIYIKMRKIWKFNVFIKNI